MSESDVEVAVLKERIEGLREQNKAQFIIVQSEMSEIKAALREMSDFMNKSKGGLKVILAAAGLAGMTGGLLIKVLTYMVSIR